MRKSQKKWISIGTPLALFTAFTLLLLSCGKKEVTPPEVEDDVSLYNSRGEKVTGLDGGETSYFGLANLGAKQQYNILLTKQGSPDTVSYARLTTDGEGRLPQTAIGYDLGLPTRVGLLSHTLSVEDYTLQVKNLDGTQALDPFTFSVDMTHPVVFAADLEMYAVNSFLAGTQGVYARGLNLTPGDSINLYVVVDVVDWSDGMNLVEVSGGVETIVVGGDGSFFQLVWTSPSQIGPYDLIADLDQDGVLDLNGGDLVDSYHPTGFMVQGSSTGADIQVQIACDVTSNYVDLFYMDENVFAFINPRTQQAAPHTIVDKYVVPHKAVWNTGDSLNDVTEGPETDTPQSGCTNQGRVLIWPSPTPGIYDLIIDVNRDGVYTRGTDFLDNIDFSGNPTRGFIVADQNNPNPPAVEITYPSNGDTLTDRVVSITGTVTPTNITTAQLTLNGTSQIIDVFEGYFSAPVVLERGANSIRIEAINENGMGFDVVTLYGDFPFVDIRVTLTWQGGPSTDVDLHVLQPDSEECYYGNPTTAIGGELDVDDVEGYGPENYTLERGEAIDGPYLISVNFYDDDQQPGEPISATIKVLLKEETPNEVTRIFGPQIITTPDYNGNDPNAWWMVVQVNWPEGTFEDYPTTGLLTEKRPGPQKRKE